MEAASSWELVLPTLWAMWGLPCHLACNAFRFRPPATVAIVKSGKCGGDRDQKRQTVPRVALSNRPDPSEPLLPQICESDMMLLMMMIVNAHGRPNVYQALFQVLHTCQINPHNTRWSGHQYCHCLAGLLKHRDMKGPPKATQLLSYEARTSPSQIRASFHFHGRQPGPSPHHCLLRLVR